MGETRGWQVPKKLVFTNFGSMSLHQKNIKAYYNIAALITQMYPWAKSVWIQTLLKFVETLYWTQQQFLRRKYEPSLKLKTISHTVNNISAVWTWNGFLTSCLLLFCMLWPAYEAHLTVFDFLLQATTNYFEWKVTSTSEAWKKLKGQNLIIFKTVHCTSR